MVSVLWMSALGTYLILGKAFHSSYTASHLLLYTNCLVVSESVCSLFSWQKQAQKSYLPCNPTWSWFLPDPRVFIFFKCIMLLTWLLIAMESFLSVLYELWGCFVLNLILSLWNIISAPCHVIYFLCSFLTHLSVTTLSEICLICPHFSSWVSWLLNVLP